MVSKEISALIEFVNGFSLGICLLDTNLNILFINKHGKKLLAVSEEPSNPLNIYQIIPNFPTFQGTAPVFYDIKVDNRELWISALTTSHGSNNKTICFISKKKIPIQFEDYINIEQELDDILKHSFDGIGVVDKNFITRRLNPSFEKMAGLPHNTFINRPCADLVKKGYFDKLAAFEAAKTKQNVFLIQHYFKTNRVALINCNPVLDKNNEVSRIISNVRDITMLYQMQEKLKNIPEHLAQQQNLEKREAQEVIKTKDDTFLYRSDTIEKLMQLVHQVARLEANVMIYGESGVGKGLLAKILYDLSDRKGGPFVKVNCGAIPETLIESELFGYEPGAFTGARREGKQGLIQAADKGILFLDEIGELLYSLQPRLLEFLQDMEFKRIGGTKPIKVNVRVIAATNQDLTQKVKENRFRADLYYRLNVIPIHVPPLREHKQDIPLLVDHYSQIINSRFKLKKVVSDALLKHLMHYDWPGNVRELEHLLETLFASSMTNVIMPEDLYKYREPALFSGMDNTKKGTTDNILYKKAMRIYEKKLLTEAISIYGTIKAASEALQLDPSTIWRKLKGK